MSGKNNTSWLLDLQRDEIKIDHHFLSPCLCFEFLYFVNHYVYKILSNIHILNHQREICMDCTKNMWFYSKMYKCTYITAFIYSIHFSIAHFQLMDIFRICNQFNNRVKSICNLLGSNHNRYPHSCDKIVCHPTKGLATLDLSWLFRHFQAKKFISFFNCSHVICLWLRIPNQVLMYYFENVFTLTTWFTLI